MARRSDDRRPKSARRRFSGRGRQKLEKRLEEATLQASAGEPRSEGRIVALASGACEVEAEGRRFDCVLPSILAHRQQSSVAVGDRVSFAAHSAELFRVEEVHPRRTVLARPDPQNPRLERVLAANVDTAVIVVSFKNPPLAPALIDRFLVVVQRGGAKPLLCVNKLDLADATERAEALEKLASYRDLGLEVIVCCARNGEGLDLLRSALAGRTAVFTGHSGVGKSSLLNALGEEVEAQVGAVSTGSGRGRHTTTRSRLYRLAGGIEVIDTPGIRELGMIELDRESLRDYFPELQAYAEGCRFNDCSHSHEPDCAVRAAVGEDQVPRRRYETYLRMLADLGQRGS